MMDRDVVANAKGISQASNLVLLHPVAIFARKRDERKVEKGKVLRRNELELTNL